MPKDMAGAAGGRDTEARRAFEELELAERAARHAEAESKRLSALLRAIGETSPDLIYVKDREGRMVFANPATASVIGVPMEKLIGYGGRDWASDLSEAHAIDMIDARVMAQARQEIAEERFTSPDGQVRVFRSAKSPVLDDEGTVIGLAGVSTDITAIRVSEQAFREGEERLQFALEAAGMVAWEYNLETKARRLSANAAALLGPEMNEATDFRELVHPDDQERLMMARAALKAGSPAYETEVRVVRPDGQIQWVAIRGRLIHNSDGPPVRLAGIQMDVTARKLAEIAAEKAAGEFAALAEATPGMLFIALPSGENIYANHFYTEFTGVSQERLRGHCYLECIHPDDRPANSEVWQAANQSGGLYEQEFRVRRADGAWRWHLCRALPVRDGQGAIERWVGTCIDIHERRLAETELQRRVDLAIAERETAMHQLHEAQKLETIGQLTGGVAHDFNNLLTPIVGSLDLLRRKIDDERTARLIDGALASAERARTLIQRLLAFARRATLQPRAVDPAALVAGMRDLVESSLSPVIVYSAEVQPDLPPALIDPNQLELALLNLSVNARDAMPSGGRLTWAVAAETLAADQNELRAGCYIRIDVRDTGHGMDADTRTRAIEPFFSTKPAGKGTGLGLSMVHGLAAQSGGTFRLESAPGQGTTATLWLPVAQAAVAGPLRESEPRRAIRRARVLLVDDEEEVRFMTAESLIELGYDVEALSSASEALDRIGQGMRPDLLVTDHLMPGMTGAELARGLRQRMPTLPILMITGYAQLEPEEIGGFEVLVKPYRHAELALRVAELLAENPVGQRAPA